MTPEEGQGFGQDLHDFAHQQASGRRWLIADYEAGDVVFHTMRESCLYSVGHVDTLRRHPSRKRQESRPRGSDQILSRRQVC